MVNTREIAAAVIGGVMLIGTGTYLYVTYREKAPVQEAADSSSGTLRIPTVDEMCKTLGATEGDALKQCQAGQRAAGEFVIAWMAFNNFIVDGELNLGQIQSIASLDDSGALAGLGPDDLAGLDPSLGLDLGADPSEQSQIAAGIDPATGAPLGFLQSPAQLALYCLQMAGDWVTLHDCISENDPSSSISGIQ